MYKKEGNIEKTIKYFSFSEENEFLPSIVELGVLYYDDSFLKRNLSKAYSYFRKAAIRNDALAQNNLGWMYEHGEGTTKDVSKALYWYSKASQNGFELGLENMNRLENYKKINYVSF